jgi:Fe-S-cluster containining protein
VCHQCGLCCRKTGVPLSAEDLNHEPRLWDVALHISGVANPRMRAYMLEKGYEYVIRKDHKGSPCPFLYNTRCMIYGTRPKLCRLYPMESQCFWEKKNAVSTTHRRSSKRTRHPIM